MSKNKIAAKLLNWFQDPTLLAAGGFVLLGLSLAFWHWQAPKFLLSNATAQQLPVPTPLPVSAIPVMLDEQSQPLMNTKITQLMRQFSASISAQTIYAIDLGSASVLLEKNATASAFPASTTKLMTALVARQNYALDQSIEVGEADQSSGSVIGFAIGEKVTIKDLLSAALIQSGNDAATILATHYPGGQAAFIQQMNKEAQLLHMNQTTYTNPTGIDDYRQKTTARDLSIVARQVWLDPLLQQLANTKSLELTTSDGQLHHQLTNTNELLGVEPGVMGLKTGTTDLAKEVLVTVTQRDGHQVLIVLMDSQNRYDDTRAIIHWIYGNYHWLDASQVLNSAAK